MISDFWTDERVGVLTRMAAERRSFSQVAKALGCTRSMVAGKAGRLGLSFHGQVIARPPKPPKPREPRTVRQKNEAKVAAWQRVKARLEAMGTPWTGRPSDKRYPLEYRVDAVAHYLAGRGLLATTRKFGVNPISIHKMWAKDPEVVALATPLAWRYAREDEAAVAEAIRCESEAERERQERAEEARQLRAEHNELLWPTLNPRHAAICRVYEEDQRSMQDIATALGLTRERIRQILTACKAKGVMFRDGGVNGKLHPRKPYVATSEPQRETNYAKSLAKGDGWWNEAAAKPKRAFRDIERRREHMRRVGLERQAKLRAEREARA